MSDDRPAADGNKTPTNSPNSQNSNVTELKSFIMREAPPPRQINIMTSSAASLSERETCSSPIVYVLIY